MFYAEIDENNKVKAILDTPSEIDLPHMIEVETMDSSLIGKIYNDPNFESDPSDPSKTIYPMDQFIAKLKPFVRAIKSAADTSDVLATWVFAVPTMATVNLNNLPEWFTDGIDAMVAEPSIPITQQQADSFLEV